MGEHNTDRLISSKTRAAYIKGLLEDIEVLEKMLDEGMIESGITRIGAEQEFCIVDENWRPAKTSERILESINDPHFTTELARFNLEINLDPLELQRDCFSQVEQTLRNDLAKAQAAADKENCKVLLAGILPTISKNELDLDYMTPSPRYWALNDMMKEVRGSDFELHLRGIDELSIKHDSVLFEACNTSFQTHLQIQPHDFTASFNWAQAIAGPVLGVCSNSPLLLGRELWSETRIALFQQSIDSRTSSFALKDQMARVNFGTQWATGSAADLFKDDIARHKVIITKQLQEDSKASFNAGKPPKLEALCLFNGTVYKWNRACYGVGGGKAHLRIENRYIPSGPSIVDEVANFAFWVGLMVGRPSAYDNLPELMDFRDAKSNFIKAARTGKETVLRWFGKQVSVRDLVTKELLPIAYDGLVEAGIERKDIERYLEIIRHRAARNTGAQWQVKNYRSFRKELKQDDALLALTKTMHDHQASYKPVHEWEIEEGLPHTHEAAHQVGHIMSTQLFTVNEHDLASLATSLMEWKNIRHLPVESTAGDFCGLLTKTHVERHREREGSNDESLVSDIMARDVVAVEPTTEIKEAIRIMKSNEYGCLPIVHGDHLIGIVTISDVIPFDK